MHSIEPVLVQKRSEAENAELFINMMSEKQIAEAGKAPIAKPAKEAKRAKSKTKKCGKRLAYHCTLARCRCKGKRSYRPRDMKHTEGQEPILKPCRWPQACRLCTTNKCK